MQHQVAGVKLDVAMLNVDMFSTRTDLCSLQSPSEWKVSISAIEEEHPPPPRTVGFFLSSRFILISLLRSEGEIRGLAVCTEPLEAGRDKFPEFFPASSFILRAAAAAFAAALAAASVPRRAASSADRMDPEPVSMAKWICKINKIIFVLLVFLFDKQNRVLVVLLPMGAVNILLVWGPIEAPNGSKNGVMQRAGGFQKDFVSRETFVKNIFE